MATQTEDNGFLYFIVGGLVVVVAVISFFYFNSGSMSTSPDSPTIIERTERTIEKAAPSTTTNSTEFRVDEDGASATQTTTQD